MNALRQGLGVDDDPTIGKSFDRVLARKGYVVVKAENGMEALNKISHEDYDAVFTDIRMPGMDGIEVAERVRAKRPWTPVVIITGYGSAEHEARAEAVGVRGFMRKPLSPDMIEKGLEAAVAPSAAEVATATAPEALGAPGPEAVAEEDRDLGAFLKNVSMFFAAPFVALAYIALFPIIGLAMLARIAGRAVFNRAGSIGTVVKNVSMFVAAPFVGLASIVLFPFIGLTMLAWTGGHALRTRTASN